MESHSYSSTVNPTRRLPPLLCFDRCKNSPSRTYFPCPFLWKMRDLPKTLADGVPTASQRFSMEATKSRFPFKPSQEASESVGFPVDWSDLPADLVAAIGKRLHDLFDFVYFRAVCKKWRAATSISDLPPQFPWILKKRPDADHLSVYSLTSGKTRTIRCPKARGKHFLGPSHGYLYATNYDSNNLTNSLLNPLTNDEMMIEFEREFSGLMVCMSPDPMGSYDHIAFQHYYYPYKMAFYEPRIQDWFYVELPIYDNRNHACLKGMYYIHNPETSDTVVIDIACHSSFLVPPPNILAISDDLYFVESGEKILRVVKRLDCVKESSDFNCSFDIYQLDVIDKNCGYRWVKTSSIGNQILFIDWFGVISVAACETTGLRGNSIYCLQRCRGDILPSSSDCGLYKYNIEDGQTEKICSNFYNGSNWFVPRITGSLSVDTY